MILSLTYKLAPDVSEDIKLNRTYILEIGGDFDSQELGTRQLPTV